MTYHETSKAISGRQPEARQMGKTVLIVEDNELNMKLFHDLLDAHGYRTLQTRNGIWLRPFRNLVYAMPPYICTAAHIAQITSGMVAVARALT